MIDRLQDKRRRGWFWDTNQVFEAGLSTNAIVVRLYLARCADEAGQCFPSIATIAKKCSISRASVFRALTELEETGWLKRDQRIKNNAKTSNVYTLLTPSEEIAVTKEEPSPIEEQGWSHSETGVVSQRDGGSLTERRGWSHSETGVVSQRDIEGLPNEGLPTEGLPNEVYVSSSDNPTEIIDYFNEVWKDHYPRGFTVTDKRRKKINTRLKTFSVDDIKRAINNLHNSPWHIGNNPSGWKATIDFLIRNDEQIDTWANNPPMGGKQSNNRYDPAHVDWEAEAAKYLGGEGK